MTGRKINFDLINARALDRLESLLGGWLPDGKKSGGEFKALNPTRSDTKPGSFSINLTTCAWADFACGDKGGDPISLYAYLNNLSQKDAALALAQQLGLGDAPAPAGSAVAKKKPRTDFVPILPVPDDAPPPPKAHVVRGLPDGVWRYADASGALLGYVYRFATSDGGKEILPLTFCAHAVTGEREWRWVSWPMPRPLYGQDRLRAGKPVLLVEGEKCADAAWTVTEVRAAFDVITWSGGAKAWDKTEWSATAGRDVVIWPDCDAQTDKQGKIKPEAEQPGMMVAEQIAQRLQALGCKVRIVKIPAPGEKPGGWDIADATAEGWDGARLLAFMRGNLRPPAQATVAAPVAPRTGEDGGADWYASLIRKRGEIAGCPANILDMLINSPEWQGAVGFNEFSQRIVKLKPPPFTDSMVGEWLETDEIMATMMLSRKFSFTPSEAVVMKAIQVFARKNSFHPPRDWLRGLVWDGVPRIDDWVTDYFDVPKTDYTLRVARWFLMGMVARVMRPGVKFDYCLVLEGFQGKGKSSALAILGGEWFGDTDLDLSNKDSMLALHGKWLYEFPELGSLTRSDSSKQKSFLTRLVDEFRAPYGKQMISCPRQVVFAGSTNEWEWNKDPTGGRRFWPIECGNIDLSGLRDAREQLFAEALVRYDSAERFHPTLREQRELFDPEQLKREQQESLIDALHDWVFSMSRDFSIADAAHDGLKADASKMTRDFTTRIGIALRKLGCERVEKRNGMTRYWYKPPVRNEATSSVGTSVEEDDHVPF